MAVRTTVVGSYPKPPAQGTFKVRKTLHALERGDATVTDLEAAQDELVAEVIAEQEAAGTDLVTDGHARWDDILTPFAKKLDGFDIGGLLRWFDNNVYYRKPICTGPVGWVEPCAVDAFEFAARTANNTVKQVVPGPITFARLSIDEHYNAHDEFVLAIARALASEVKALEAAGAEVIQIDEPALLDAPEDLDLAGRAIGEMTRGLTTASTILATYFGDAKRLGTDLFGLPVQGFGFDLVSGPESRAIIEEAPADAVIQAGIVDARNTKLEDPSDLKDQIRALADSVGAERLWVSPSAGLEFLPREKARAKIQRLAEAAKGVES